MTATYLSRLFDLTNTTALITGGSSGIGYAIAEALGRAGATITLVARGIERLTIAKNQLEHHGIHTHIYPADLSDPTTITDIAHEITTFSEPDILVTAAGTNPRPHLNDLDYHTWTNTLNLNLNTPFLLGQHYGPAMARRGYGRIINIASQQSIRAFGNSGAYGVSKTAISGLTRTQAEAWSPHGVCCNAIAPGFVHTPLTTNTFAVPGQSDALAARTMAKRNGQPSDFAGIAVFLASRASDYLTGQTIFVDGGFSAT